MPRIFDATAADAGKPEEMRGMPRIFDGGAAEMPAEMRGMPRISRPEGTAWPTWGVARSGSSWLAAGSRTVRGQRFSFAFWDSTRIQLSLVPGRVDPGGTGRIPEEARPRLVAAFNGGFRSVHGHYGLRAEGRTFAPARAGLATLAEAADGTWWLGTAGDASFPADVRSFRQNLPPLLEGERFDPTGKDSFGALAPGKTGGRTTRSALGLRPDGGFVYAYGIDVTAEELAAAVSETGATYGMALDINDGQAGFEWLEVGEAASGPARAPERSAMKARWSGLVAGHRVHAERLSTPMGTPLPRWLGGDPRDFFFLSRAAELAPVARLGTVPASAGPDEQKEK